MNRTLLIVYEPALFLVAALGWAAWEFWSMRKRKSDAPKKADRAPPSEPPSGAAG